VPYRDANDRAEIHKLLALDAAGIEVPPGNKLPRTVDTRHFKIITSQSRNPDAAWKWMHFETTNMDVVHAECRRGTVPQRRDAMKHLGDPEWFPYPYQAQVYDTIENHCEMWPTQPLHGPVQVLRNDEVFRRWFYQGEEKDLATILRRARDEVARFSAAANEGLAEDIRDGKVRPEDWTFADWDAARGGEFFRRQQEAFAAQELKARIDEATARLERLHPGSPESPRQVLWVPAMMAAAVLCWLLARALRDARTGRPMLADAAAGARRGWPAYVFVLPGMTVLFAFVMYPSLYQLYLSLHKGSGLAPLQYIGWENYRRVLDFTYEHWDRAFWTKVLPNTALYMVIVTAGQIAIALLFASLLNMPLRANRLYRVLFFIPLVTSLAIVSVIFIGLLAGPESGLNHFLKGIGLAKLPYWLGLVDDPSKPFDWLSGTGGPSWLRTDLMMVMLVGLWHGLPYTIILLLAGLQSISPTLYEAAKVDGAGAWKRFRHVTIPEILPILIVIAFNALIGASKAFSAAYVLTEGGTDHSSELVSTYVFKWGFTRPQGMDAKLGYASALGVVFSVVLAVLSFTNFYLIVRRWKRRMAMERAAAGGPADARR
jgi:putative chitobiose transport system permease protein